MLAIPSPDVLMNLFASAAQVLGLLALCLGGGWFARRRQPGAAIAAPSSRLPFAVASLLLVGVSVWFLLYHLSVVDAEHRRLHSNLVRSSQEAGKKVGDTSLKTLTYSEQTEHPRGITTDQLQQWHDEHRPLNLIDVRETEEVEMGRIHGTWARRYPDLQADRDGLLMPGKETILLCESGNRSSELSDYFFEQGITTKFMIGGYEKWVAEGRAMDGCGTEDRDDLRAVPDFPNKNVLLTTQQVDELYRTTDLLFVDVRYPKDFDLGHLPGAVDIPLRRLRSEEAAAELAKLPHRPIVAPCYDKRSSFYALILGVRLARAGYDFRGRYTVPFEFALPQKDSEWVARWNATNAERTVFGSARARAIALLGWLEGRLGGLALAIAAAALLLRLLMLPLAARAERDSIVQRRLAPEMAALRARLAHDAVRLRRAVMATLRRNRIAVTRNLFASLAVLLAFMVLFAAVERRSAASADRFLWAPLAAPDPTFALPLLAAALLAAIVALQASGSKGRWLGALFVAGITWLVATCNAGAQLYLVASFSALLLQSVCVRRALRTPAAAPPARAHPGLVPLRAAAGCDDLGGKARRLGDLVAAGFHVPDGFVVPDGHEPGAAELDAAFARLGARLVAVRSSARGEDGEHKSFAGEFRTMLEVQQRDLRGAIAAVRASYGGRAGGVVVQAMVPAEYAGVMFTEDPAHSGRALIEMVRGLGEGLVSGNATPTEHRFARHTGRAVGEGSAPMDLRPLLELGLKLEELFGAPQDVEWAFAGGRFVLLQSRNVTRRAGDGTDPVAVREAERARLLRAARGAAPDEPLFGAGDYAALLPEPTPYSLALLQDIWAPGGSVDLACRRLGVRYLAGEDAEPCVLPVFGRCCIDLRAASARVRSTAAAGFRLGLRSPAIDAALTEQFLPEFRRAARLREAVDLQRLDLPELHELLASTRQRFLESTYVESEVVNLAAEAYFATARRRLEKRGLDPGSWLGEGLHTVVRDAFALLATAEPVPTRVQRFLAAFGHRAPHDFELAEPRFAGTPEVVAAMAHSSALPPLVEPRLPDGRLLRIDVERARRFQELKEAAKHEAMRELALLRAILLELGRRHGLAELIFWLLPGEVARLPEPEFARAAAELARGRQRELAWLRAVPVPDLLTAAELETLGEQQPLPAVAAGGLRGIRVAGDRDVVGRVRVLTSPAELGRLASGEILVVRCTDPCWLPAFRVAGGLVSEVGGWLSHAAIQAREHNLPAIVGLAGATVHLRDGQNVRLHRDGSVECLNESA